jgi:hypothetical protein
MISEKCLLTFDEKKIHQVLLKLCSSALVEEAKLEIEGDFLSASVLLNDFSQTHERTIPSSHSSSLQQQLQAIASASLSSSSNLVMTQE